MNRIAADLQPRAPSDNPMAGVAGTQPPTYQKTPEY